MTTDKYPNKNSIKGTIRRLFTRCPRTREVLKGAVHPTKKGVRGGKRFVCNICKGDFPQKDVRVDHITPVIPLDKTVHDLSYDELVHNIFCGEDNLQVLCVHCHKKKTAKERRKRSSFKKKKQEK